MKKFLSNIMKEMWKEKFKYENIKKLVKINGNKGKLELNID